MKNNYQYIYILGDTHGHWLRFFQDVERLDIRDALVIHVGDVGVGFSSQEGEYTKLHNLNKKLAERNINMIAIRGNHDEPQYFSDNTTFSHLELLRDYTTREINGEKFLFVGGAISVDRYYRSSGIDYWPEEAFVLDEEKAQKCDVLITHTAPSWIGPSHHNGFCVQFFGNDPKLKEELGEEREKMNRLFELTRPNHLFCGHFHTSECKYNSGCWGRILDINELIRYEKTESQQS